MTSKSDKEIRLAELETERVGMRYDLLGLIAKCCVLPVSIAVVLAGIRPILIGQSPETIEQMAKLVDSFHFGSLAGYLWGAVATTGAVVANSSRKRLKQKVAKLEQGRRDPQDGVRTADDNVDADVDLDAGSVE